MENYAGATPFLTKDSKKLRFFFDASIQYPYNIALILKSLCIA